MGDIVEVKKINKDEIGWTVCWFNHFIFSSLSDAKGRENNFWMFFNNETSMRHSLKLLEI